MTSFEYAEAPKIFLTVFYCNVKENNAVCFNPKTGLVESHYLLKVCIGEDLYICPSFLKSLGGGYPV